MVISGMWAWKRKYLCECMHVCVGGQKLMSGDFLGLIPPCVLTQSLLLNVEITQLSSLTNQLVLRQEQGGEDDPLPLLPEP